MSDPLADAVVDALTPARPPAVAGEVVSTSPALLVSVLGSEVSPLSWLPTPLVVGDRVLLLRSEGVWHVVVSGLRVPVRASCPRQVRVW